MWCRVWMASRWWWFWSFFNTTILQDSMRRSREPIPSLPMVRSYFNVYQNPIRLLQGLTRNIFEWVHRGWTDSTGCTIWTTHEPMWYTSDTTVITTERRVDTRSVHSTTCREECCCWRKWYWTITLWRKRTGVHCWHGAEWDDLRTVGHTVFALEAVYAHQWQAGEAILWDNHRLLHTTVPLACYMGESRLMWQIICKTTNTPRSWLSY